MNFGFLPSLIINHLMTPSDLSRDPPEGLEPHVGNLWNKPKLRMKKFKLAPPQPATHDNDIFSLARYCVSLSKNKNCQEHKT